MKKKLLLFITLSLVTTSTYTMQKQEISYKVSQGIKDIFSETEITGILRREIERNNIDWKNITAEQAQDLLSAVTKQIYMTRGQRNKNPITIEISFPNNITTKYSEKEENEKKEQEEKREKERQEQEKIEEIRKIKEAQQKAQEDERKKREEEGERRKQRAILEREIIEAKKRKQLLQEEKEKEEVRKGDLQIVDNMNFDMQETETALKRFNRINRLKKIISKSHHISLQQLEQNFKFSRDEIEIVCTQIKNIPAKLLQDLERRNRPSEQNAQNQDNLIQELKNQPGMTAKQLKKMGFSKEQIKKAFSKKDTYASREEKVEKQEKRKKKKPTKKKRKTKIKKKSSSSDSESSSSSDSESDNSDKKIKKTKGKGNNKKESSDQNFFDFFKTKQGKVTLIASITIFLGIMFLGR